MNILGEGFPPEIVDQVAQRQRRYGSGYTTNREPEEIVFLNANTSWVKLVSSVDVIDQKIIQDESLRTVEGIKDNNLAKKFVLFNGTINEGTNQQRAGLTQTNSALGGNSAYGIGGTEFGLRPMMGIQSAEIKHENRGSIRRATVKIKAFNRIQFDIIDALYLRLGFSVLLEWGHSMYYDNNGVLQKGSDVNNSLADAFLKGGITYDKFLDKIQKNRISSKGNYDAMFAKVSNIHWSFNVDGSYDITLDLVSIGDVIESFKINSLTNSVAFEGIPSSVTQNFASEKITEFVNLINRSTIGRFLFTIYKNMGSSPSYSLDATTYGFTTGKVDALMINWENIGQQYYIRLGTFLQFLQEKIIYQSIVADQNAPIIKFDYDTDSNLMYLENDLQVSIDPQVCMVNRTLVLNTIKLEFAEQGEPFESSLFPSSNTSYGQIMNIYVNGLWILTKLDELVDPNSNKVVLIDFLNTILSSINNSLGGTINLEPTVDETTNTIIIRDANPLPNIDTVINKLNELKYGISNKYARFDLYGYNLVNGAGSASFIKDFSFTTEISPELSTIITIGATANSTVVGENATAFSKFNAGLKDRFKEQIVQSKEERDQNRFETYLQLFQNKTALTTQFKQVFTDYVEYLIKLSGEGYESGAAETYRDTLTNIITYQQQLRQVVADINNKIAEQKGQKTTSTFAPGTGFIPFNLSLTMDGLSGMKIYSKFLIDTQVLPANYPDNAEFLIKNIVHKIENNKWFTTLESIVISKGSTDDSVYKKDKNQNSTSTSTPQSQRQNTPSTPLAPVAKGSDADFWSLVAICAAESFILLDPQGAADVAQSIYNRLNVGTYGKSIKEIIVSPGQYEPVFKNKNDWAKIKDRNTAIVAYQNSRKVSLANATLAIDTSYKAITNPILKNNAKQFVGSRTEFLANRPKSKEAVGPVERPKILNSKGKPVDTSNVFFWNYSGKDKLYNENRLAALPPPSNLPQLA
jgi:hypothetical protein